MAPKYTLAGLLVGLLAAFGGLDLATADRAAVGLGLRGLAYWAHPIFADAFKTVSAFRVLILLFR